MDWKSVICIFVVVAEISYCQSRIAVSENPIPYYYPFCEKSSIQHVGCSRSKDRTPKGGLSRRESIRKRWLHKKDDHDGNHDGDHEAHLLGKRSMLQRKNDKYDDCDHEDYPNSFHKKSEAPGAHHIEARGTDKNRPIRHRTDDDMHKDKSGAHSSSPGDRGYERDRQKPAATDHDTHRDKLNKAHSNCRVSSPT